MADYQRKTLVPLADVGPPGPLPGDLEGLADTSLADIELAVGTPAATELGYLNTGFFPVGAPVPPAAVTQVQYRLAAESLGFLLTLDAAATTAGGDTEIRWLNTVVLLPTDAWLITLVTVDAGLTMGDFTAIFAAAEGFPDALRTALGFV